MNLGPQNMNFITQFPFSTSLSGMGLEDKKALSQVEEALVTFSGE